MCVGFADPTERRCCLSRSEREGAAGAHRGRHGQCKVRSKVGLALACTARVGAIEYRGQQLTLTQSLLVGHQSIGLPILRERVWVRCSAAKAIHQRLGEHPDREPGVWQGWHSIEPREGQGRELCTAAEHCCGKG